MDKYVQQSFLPQHLEIHWFSVINSSVLVLLLLGILVTIFMRVLKHDFARFSHDDELGDETEETGTLQSGHSHTLALACGLVWAAILSNVCMYMVTAAQCLPSCEQARS